MYPMNIICPISAKVSPSPHYLSCSIFLGSRKPTKLLVIFPFHAGGNNSNKSSFSSFPLPFIVVAAVNNLGCEKCDNIASENLKLLAYPHLQMWFWGVEENDITKLREGRASRLLEKYGRCARDDLG